MSLPLRLMRSSVASRMLLAARPAAASRTNLVVKAFFSDNITYSGGQASEGQGGFYGSGGARADPENQHSHSSEEERSKMLALAADVQKITHIMEELETLEHLLQREETENPGQVSGRSIELKNSIKKLMTNPEVLETLGRLEFDGSPVWGLSMSERALVEAARSKVNEC